MRIGSFYKIKDDEIGFGNNYGTDVVVIFKKLDNFKYVVKSALLVGKVEEVNPDDYNIFLCVGSKSMEPGIDWSDGWNKIYKAMREKL